VSKEQLHESAPADAPSTADASYATRLTELSKRGGAARRVLDPQRPYRWNLRRMRPGLMLDVGCGIGRNLKHVDGNGVGVDHNEACVAECRAAGLTAYTSDEFPLSPDAVHGRYDSLLFAHVLEHMSEADADHLVKQYLPYLRPGGQVIVICPQAKGQASDATHVTLFDDRALEALANRLDLRVVVLRSFPFSKAFGRWFTYNETIAVLTRRAA
jgi:2-polyprenyl-3-methyl-5-hydroxy-6-metoxy-1,4-benzoquinol methylase